MFTSSSNAKMARQIHSDPNAFLEIETQARRYEAPGRTGSVALLLWFLETVYRLDDVEAEDSVCDSQGDGGFDAIATNDMRREIVVFQSKRKERIPATLGDVDLKTFVGSLTQLASGDSTRLLASTTKSSDLKKLLEELNVADKVDAGYQIRAIFVTNVAGNHDAIAYAKHVEASGQLLELWDLARFRPVLDQLKRDWFVPDDVRLNIDPYRLFVVGSSRREPDLVYAAIRARQLVHLPGIDDSRIFAQNVRLGLGGTRVNDDLLDSVKDKTEHANFLTFHNGLTIVSKNITIRGKTLRLRDFSVCNGCQSLLTFYNNRKLLTEDLEVLVRIVRVGDDLSLPAVIAYRTNNQNAISLRDLSSNAITQVRLKAEFDSAFGELTTYVIKRGEISTGAALTNEFAGRLLLAIYVREPWSAHQKYRIFGDLESRIFNYHISAAHIRMAELLAAQLVPKLPALHQQRLARYGLTVFVLLYILGELMRASADGKKVLDEPLPYLSSSTSANPLQSKLLAQTGGLIDWLLTELNYFVKSHGDDSYDYKREFKSPKAVEALRDELLKAFDKDRHIGRASAFAVPK